MQHTSQQRLENASNYRFYLKNIPLNLNIIFTAALFIFSYAPSPFSFFIYFAFIPFLKLLEENTNHADAFKHGYIIGLLVNIFVFNWIVYYNLNSYLILVALNPIQFASFAYFYSHLKVFSFKIRLIIFPFLWTFFEYIREFGDLALNWLNIGYTQGNYLQSIQFADITGLNGVVFWICIINAVLFVLIHKKQRLRDSFVFGAILLLLFILPYLYGQFRLSENRIFKGIKATYIQPNIDSSIKWKYKNYSIDSILELSDTEFVESNSLLIWPETAVPTYLQHDRIDSMLQDFVNKSNAALLSGILYDTSIVHQNYFCNSAVLIQPDSKNVQFYHKIKLVPSEENLPFSSLYNFMLPDEYKSRFYLKGSEYKVFKSNLKTYALKFKDKKWLKAHDASKYEKVKFSTVICFESSFPSFVRQFINSGAEFIVVITNDEWFKFSPQSVQHLITSRFRAIESRRSVIHSSNGGISAFIDPFGRFYGESPLLKKYGAAQFVTISNKRTIFNIYGDWISRISTIFILSVFIVIFYKNKKKLNL